MNVTGIAKTITHPAETNHTEHRPLLISNLPSSKLRCGAEILKKSEKFEQVPESLAKLKETILKQKENRFAYIQFYLFLFTML